MTGRVSSSEHRKNLYTGECLLSCPACKAGRTTSPRLLPVCARCGARRDLLPCCDRHQHVLCRECYLLATADPINCGVEVPDA